MSRADWHMAPHWPTAVNDPAPQPPQMKALLSRTVTNSNGRSADGGRTHAWGTKSRSVALADADRAGARRRAQVAAASSSYESSQQDEAESASIISGQGDAPAAIDLNGAEKYHRLREIHLSDLSPAAAEEFVDESGCMGMDRVSWKETHAHTLAQGSFVQKTRKQASSVNVCLSSLCGDDKWHNEAVEEEGEERVDAGGDPAAGLSGDEVQEGALRCGHQLEDEESVHAARSGEVIFDVAGPGSEGEQAVACDDEGPLAMGASAAWELVRDVFEQNDNTCPLALDLPAPMPMQDGIVPSIGEKHGVPDAHSLASAGVNSAQSDYGHMLVSLERLNASSGGIEAIVEQDAMMHSHNLTEKGRGPQSEEGQEEMQTGKGRGSQSEEGQEVLQKRNDDVFIRELQALRREVGELRMHRQRADEVARLEQQPMWHMRTPKTRDRGRERMPERQASWVHSSNSSRESVPRGVGRLDNTGTPFRAANGGLDPLLCVGDLQGLQSAGQVPTIVIKLCKQLDREAKLHVGSLKSLVKESRRATAQQLRDKVELTERIEELERQLHAAIESSCSKEDMTHSYHVLRSMQNQRTRVVEAETQCRVTNEMLAALKTELQALRQDHANAQAGLAAALADVAASSEEASEHYEIAQRALADASALRDELAKAREDFQELQEKLLGLKGEREAAEERADKAEHAAKIARQAAATAEKQAASKRLLADAATKKLAMLGISVPDMDAAVPVNMPRKQFWQAEGEEEALPVPTTFLRQADSGDGHAAGVRESIFRTDVEEDELQMAMDSVMHINAEGTFAADGDEQEGGAAKRAPWVVRKGDQLIESAAEAVSKPLARGLYGKLFAGKRREALQAGTIEREPGAVLDLDMAGGGTGSEGSANAEESREVNCHNLIMVCVRSVCMAQGFDCVSTCADCRLCPARTK